MHHLDKRGLLLATALIHLYVAGATAVRVTVSGQSAGASMAINHLFAFSSLVDGAAIAAGSPYGCGNLTTQGLCYYGPLNSTVISTMNAYISQRFEHGLIDDPSNLKDTPVVLFSGSNDWVVFENVMKSIEQQLQTHQASTTSVFNTSAAHVWSLDHGACGCGECWAEKDYRLMHPPQARLYGTNVTP